MAAETGADDHLIFSIIKGEIAPVIFRKKPLRRRIKAADTGDTAPQTVFTNGVTFYGRGKYLGSSVTVEQYAAIGAGTFDDLFIGDYWTIGGVNWRIAAFDYWYGFGGGTLGKCQTHHVCIVPDKDLLPLSSGKYWLKNANNTTGAYVGINTEKYWLATKDYSDFSDY